MAGSRSRRASVPGWYDRRQSRMSESRTARFARGVVSALSGLMVVGAVLGVAAALVLFTPGNNAAAVTEEAGLVATTTTTTR